MSDYQAKRVKRLYQDVKDLPDKQRETVIEALLGAQASKSLERKKQVEVTMASDLLEETKERYKFWGKMVGLKTGYESIDKMTMGLAPGEMTVIGGRTSSGKTATAINITANVLRQGKPVLFVTLEMTPVEVSSRFYHLLGDDFEKLSTNLYFQKSDELDWKSIDSLIEYAKKDCGAELVVIDHLHYFTRELENVSEDLGRITKEFKKNAIRHEVPIILISHTRKTHATELSNDDLRGSSYVAQDADIVLMVSQDQDWPETINITLTKNRNRMGVKEMPAVTRLGFKGTRIY